MMNLQQHQFPKLFFKFPGMIHIVWFLRLLLYPRVWILSKCIKNIRFPVKRVLDLGGGDGQYAWPFYRRGKVVTIVDKSIENVRFLEQLVPGATIINDRIEAFLNGDHSITEPKDFDLILCISTLPYVEDYRMVLKQLRYSMGTESRLLLYVPVNENQELRLYRWIFKRFTTYETSMQRRHIFNTTSLLGELHEIGFNQIEQQPAYGYFGRYSHEFLSIGTILLSQTNGLLKLGGLIWLITYLPLILTLNLLEFWFPPKANQKHNSMLLLLGVS